MVVERRTVEKYETYDQHAKHLYLLLKKGGYSHEIIFFMLKKYLYSEMTFNELMNKFGNLSLFQLSTEIQVNINLRDSTEAKDKFEEYNVGSGDQLAFLDAYIVIFCFRNLDIVLHKTVEQNKKKKDHSSSKWRKILKKKSGDTRLWDYLSEETLSGSLSAKQENALSRWLRNVRKNFLEARCSEEFQNASFDQLLALEKDAFAAYISTHYPRSIPLSGEGGHGLGSKPKRSGDTSIKNTRFFKLFLQWIVLIYGYMPHLLPPLFSFLSKKNL